MKRYFQRYRDDRFALTTLQNPDREVRTSAELVQAAQQEREWQTAARIPATQPLATPAAPVSATSAAGNSDSASPNSTNDDAQQILESLVADVATAGTALPSFPSLTSSDDELSAPPPQNLAAKQRKSHVANTKTDPPN